MMPCERDPMFPSDSPTDTTPEVVLMDADEAEPEPDMVRLCIDTPFVRYCFLTNRLDYESVTLDDAVSFVRAACDADTVFCADEWYDRFMLDDPRTQVTIEPRTEFIGGARWATERQRVLKQAFREPRHATEGNYPEVSDRFIVGPQSGPH